MKCFECGSKMSERNEEFPFGDLSYVTLVAPVRSCECGYREEVIPNQEALTRALVELVIRKEGRLVGEEVRFLRTFLGYSGEYFANVVGKRPETVSKWENSKEPMGAGADRLLRLLASKDAAITAYGAGDLAKLPADRRPAVMPTVEPKRLAHNNGWQAA